ncbi:MAG: hypothetical protein ACRENH_09410 [Gemmatimonadaceae bacterium]
MRLLKRILAAGAVTALSGFLVSACAKDPLTAPSTPSVAPAAGLTGTVNTSASPSRADYVKSADKNGANKGALGKKKRSGYMVSSS